MTLYTRSLSTLLLCCLTVVGWSQTVPSSCTAAANIVEQYQDDADRLALRQILADSTTYIDSIHIPQDQSDTILDALIAVYNATALPARDTVVTMYGIHSFPYPEMKQMSFAADSNLIWMQQLEAGNQTSGNAPLDSTMLDLGLSVTEYFAFGATTFSYDIVYVQSTTNYNMFAVSDHFLTLPDIQFADPGSWAGDGYDLSGTIESDHVALTYSIGWGDCPAGCIFRRYWDFKVYFDCSVEFVGSYGEPIWANSVPTGPGQSAVGVFPTPFTETLNIKGLTSSATYSLYNLSGQLVLQGQTNNGQLEGSRELPAGSYILQLNSNNESTTHRVVKY